ncbi:DUF983 domain-containing protein [Eisenibacter elegans]|uniref:DUF983 domain-containing protein n=1 Tax=Eisenibacter elegans TaxID=997 RepID=UPI00041DC597|nr:DUF983 domain-containing protein [Eisenibacter elegans]
MNNPPRVGLLPALWQQKCPRCRQGNMFTHTGWSFTHFAKMHTHCSECGLRYEREPRFFDGAMYISYAFSVATFVSFSLATYIIGMVIFGTNPPVWVYMLVVTMATLFWSRFSLRYSRTLMLYIFGDVQYDPDRLSDKHKA